VIHLSSKKAKHAIPPELQPYLDALHKKVEKLIHREGPENPDPKAQEKMNLLLRSITD
jgi:hypothetical protein